MLLLCCATHVARRWIKFCIENKPHVSLPLQRLGTPIYYCYPMLAHVIQCWPKSQNEHKSHVWLPLLRFGYLDAIATLISKYSWENPLVFALDVPPRTSYGRGLYRSNSHDTFLSIWKPKETTTQCNQIENKAYKIMYLHVSQRRECRSITNFYILQTRVDWSILQ